MITPTETLATGKTRERFIQFTEALQVFICTALEEVDGQASFGEDAWERKEGGGGITRVLENGIVFEKAGVNTSSVHGELPTLMQQTLNVTGKRFFACGLSIVIHPVNPFVPTVHANWRYFELYDLDDQRIDAWFGGGSDLTPYYIFEEDGKHFHETWKMALDEFGIEYYPLYKKQCDDYFVNRHRNNEARGIGGIFYDYVRPADENQEEKLLRFQFANGNAFLPSYLPIVKKRMQHPYTENEQLWQEIRRGRYAEFNLVHDRGTLFGLKTNGRTESILMSLPPRARWVYDHQPVPGSREEELLKYLQPRDWVG
ncbi:MAG TPA: oxygen-dependent coproporphyrinogen oxidase [Flavitalea sp.]|nr:oxygen-dependent coproporphyrinogen oxidase [Flavitalea sp.]